MKTKTYQISRTLWEDSEWLEHDVTDGRCYARINRSFENNPSRKVISITFPIDETEELLSRADYYASYTAKDYEGYDHTRKIVFMYRGLLKQDKRQQIA